MGCTINDRELSHSSKVKVTFGEPMEGSPTRARARLLYPQEKDMILYEFVVDLVGLIFV